MLQYIDTLNFFVFLAFTILYAYQAGYIAIALVGKSRYKKMIQPSGKNHRFAVVIAARNESLVIPHLIQSIKNQHYPSKLVDIFVVADNCTDDTAAVSRKSGAIVYERFNKELVGKGYALDYLFNHIHTDYGDHTYDAYFVFDADNLLDENYIAEMNKVFDSGYNVVTSYRNSKNYSSNWISAGYSLWFLREARFLNNSRMLVNSSCAVSGTGFLLNSSIIRENHGWKYHLLTEDIQFSIASALKGYKIGYCDGAKLYDEQPCTFRQSWTQRMRWAKGFYQVFYRYGGQLLRGVLKGDRHSFSCYDMLMTVSPAVFLSMICAVANLGIVFGILTHLDSYYYMHYIMPGAVNTLLFATANCYLAFYALGLLTTISEWKQINCSTFEKIKYTFTFPFFLVTYVPISIVALFKNVEWTPILHSVNKSLDEVR